MAGFAYRDGILHADRVPLDRVAMQYGTPAYVYSADLLAARFDRLASALAPLGALICYAVKANPNGAIIHHLARRGAGADVVSEGELRRALRAGVEPARIVFAGVGKTEAEILAAIDAGILQINVESEAELRLIDEIARGRRRVVEAAIRVNPDVDAGTHAKITTGVKGGKFGIDINRVPAVFEMARELAGLRLVGLSTHLGSQLHSGDPYRAAYRRISDLVGALRGAGHRIERLDLGGGLGLHYETGDEFEPRDFAAILTDTVGGLDCRLIVEPGRWLVAPVGLLLARVLYVKDSGGRRLVVLDAGMNDLMRPALYDAHHAIRPVRAPSQQAPLAPFDVVGPICESSDVFARDRRLPPLVPGDLVVFADAGAYGASMGSTYNSRPLAVELMTSDASLAVVRRRETIEDLWRLEADPVLLSEP